MVEFTYFGFIIFNVYLGYTAIYTCNKLSSFVNGSEEYVRLCRDGMWTNEIPVCQCKLQTIYYYEHYLLF